jgi:anti-sigma regulatory factor (Ser/Thr protein kinase)
MDLPLKFTLRKGGFHFEFADAAIAHYARKLFATYMQGRVEPDSDLFSVELVFGELISNVARHAPGPVEVCVLWKDAGARLEVWDHGPGYEPDATLPASLMAEGHRGLFIVKSYAEDLVVERRGDRTVTAVTLRIRRAEPEQEDALLGSAHR